MFFIMGINQGRKDFEYSRMIICTQCGAYGRYQVFMTYTYLSLFFIPLFKWNRQYYVQTSCCGTVYALDPDIGAEIAARNDPEIRRENLALVQEGRRSYVKRCGNCGYETEEMFSFCPKCGNRL